jgi:type II secretory pathway pseudopilin PulG
MRSTVRLLQRPAGRAFALLDVMIGGTIVGTFAAVMLVQLGAAQNVSTIAGRDLAASRLVSERLEAARGRGARATCAAAGTTSESVKRGQRPYTVKTTTSATQEEPQTASGATFTLRWCEVRVEVTFTPNHDPRTVKATTRLYL